MANSNYIGNSKVSEEPKEVLRLTIVDGAITTPKIADEAVTEEKLSQDVKEKLNTQTAEIEDSAVTTPKIADGAVTEEKLSKELYTVHLMEQNPSSEPPLPGYSERLGFRMTPKKQLFYDGIVNGKPEKIKNGVYTYVLDTDRAYLDRYGGSTMQYDHNINFIKLTPGQVFVKFPSNVEVYYIIVEAIAVKRNSSVDDTTITPGLFDSFASMEAVSDNVEESPVYLFSFEKSHLDFIKDSATNGYQVITGNWGSDECYLYLNFTVGYKYIQE